MAFFTIYSSLEKRSLAIFFVTAYFAATCESFRHFYSKSLLSDGVHERTVFLDGIRGVEMVAGPREGSPRGIVVRQLSNRRQVVNLIYNGIPSYLLEDERPPEGRDDPSLLGSDEDGLELRECKVERDREEVKKFEENFDEKAHTLRHASNHGANSSKTHNGTFVMLNDDEEALIPLSFEPLTKFKELKHTCFRLNRKLRRLAKAERRERRQNGYQQKSASSLLKRSRRGLRELFILPGTKWCGSGRLAKSYNDLDGYMVVDHCCRVHDLCPSSIPRLSRKYGLYNYGLSTISHCSCDKRRKRGVTSLLSIPNTKWCGKGYSAKSYNDLGGLFGADGCCRQHDLHCPFFIRSFERRYGHFHFGLGTISHCSCDKRFKTCLKQTGTGASDVVGNVFFRIVKSNCFDFQRKKICKKRGFWSCLKWGYEKQAVIRSPISWN